MDHGLTAALLGLTLGLQHATDADHLVAVATILSRERRFTDGALIGALWGLGHSATLGVAGLVIVAFDLRLPPSWTTGLEAVVAVMLVVLGVWRLRDAVGGAGTVTAGHLLAEHDHHDGRATLHRHAHTHDGHVHDHPHVHPSRRLLSALTDRRRLPVRPLIVGAVHGMAGTAAVSLLVLTAARSAWAAGVYLAVFGTGTILGMTALTAALAYPVALALRVERARRVIAVGAGLASVAFGLAWGWRVW